MSQKGIVSSQKVENFVLNSLFFIFASVVGIYLLYVFGSEGISNDFPGYIGLFERLSYSSFNESFVREITEPGYLLIVWILSKSLSPETIFFLAGLFPLLYKINLLSNQDIFLIKHRFILLEKNLHSQPLGSGLNPRGALDFSPLYLFSK